MAGLTVGRQGILHQYSPKLTAFEHTPSPSSSNTLPPQNLLIFIGGLSDGFLTVPYTTPLSLSLPPTWSFAEVLLSSSYGQWGTASLKSDVAELSRCVSYFRTVKSGKIVLMGHSTGCQDAMEYLTGDRCQERESIDGAIIQAGVSDREALSAFSPELGAKCEVAQQMVDEGRADDIMPFIDTKAFYVKTPVTARRFLSMASPNHDGPDDYFSTDLSDSQLERSFGSLPASSPLCILFGGEDEYVEKDVDKEALVEKWIGFVKRGGGKVDETNSGVVEGATHNLKGVGDEVVEELCRRVVGFLDFVEKENALNGMPQDALPN